ncbi:hypothetical protein JTT01_01405 [Clostridium botulinum]|nr:hypothetical protein [Clostridium botulinum]
MVKLCYTIKNSISVEVDGCGGCTFPPWAMDDFHYSLRGGIGYARTFNKRSFVVCIITLILKHNLFISTIKIKVRFLGLDIEVNSKEKKHPSSKD